VTGFLDISCWDGIPAMTASSIVTVILGASGAFFASSFLASPFLAPPFLSSSLAVSFFGSSLALVVASFFGSVYATAGF